jgi:hypothetical protein
VTKCLNSWLLGTNLGSASAVGLKSYSSVFEPRLTLHRTGRTCKATHPTRSTSSCGVPCLRSWQQISRFDRYSASVLYCMAVHHLPCTFYDSSNAHGPAMRIPSTRGVHKGCLLGAMVFAIVASRGIQTVGCDCPERIRRLRLL